MLIRHTVGLLVAAIALLATAVAINSYRLWSLLGNYTVPWLLTSLAVGLIIVVAISVLCDRAPSQLRPRMTILVTAGLSIAVGLGMLIDYLSYGKPSYDWAASAGEWGGFTLILAFLFWIPKMACGHGPEQT